MGLCLGLQSRAVMGRRYQINYGVCFGMWSNMVLGVLDSMAVLSV